MLTNETWRVQPVGHGTALRYLDYTTDRLGCSTSRAWDCTAVLRLHHRQTWSYCTTGWKDASEI